MATASFQAPSRYNTFGSVGAKPPTSDKMSQGAGKTFADTTWRSDNIWASKFGSAFPTQRDATGSRGNPKPLDFVVNGISAKRQGTGSDEVSPTAPSGSAQLNHQSEAEPRVPSSGPRGGFWSSQDAASGNTSPSISRDSMVDSQYFTSRSVVGQNGNSLSGLSKSQTRLNPSSVPFNNSPMFGGDLDNMQFSQQAKYSFDQSPASFHRGSQDFANPRLGRESGGLLNSRSSDLGQQAPGAMPQYSFDTSIANNAALNSNRPSITHQSISYPLNGVSQRGRNGGDRDMATLFKNSLSLEDSYDTDPHGYGNPGLPLNPSSQSWSQEYENSGRPFGPGYQQDSFADQVPGAYYGPKRGSVDRNSPASVQRTGFNSPRFAPGPNPRSDAYLSRPGSSRNSVLGQDIDRTQGSSQYVSQNPPFYPSNQYYSPNVTSQYGPQPTHYDIYGQNAGYRNPMTMPPYGMPMNTYLPGMNAPVRSSRDTDPGRGVRSQTLEEFRANNKSSKRYDLKDIYEHIVEFSGDQHGSRFIQEKLQTANSDEKDQVFREIEANALQLMKDVFGNYVIQKFFEHGNQVQKKIIAGKMKGKVAELSTQMYACRVVQKALEHVLVEQQEEIVEELKPDIMRIVKDQNGNHVVQKIISMVPRMCVPFMMNAFRGHVHSLAAHNYGCRVVQRMLEQGTETERRELMDEVHSCIPHLISDQFGNYVAQHIVVHGSTEDRSRIIGLVVDELISLSKHKFASNVVEKCIEYGTLEDRKAIRIKLTTPSSDGTSPLQAMMRDQFGNYKKMLKTLKGEDRASFVTHLTPEVESAKKNAPSRQVTAVEGLINNPDEIDPSAPGLQLDVNSASPTPGLTTEHNSPDSSSPPSTNSGADEDAVHDHSNAKIAATEGQPHLVVQVDEAER
ncbi:armadillo-type protein [Apiospora aurea]|uniref:Armadillo-type protein n=1 Tax=Apiospora aurea TaxID=335848 RepID=A0ABR1QF09_9PEZI